MSEQATDLNVTMAVGVSRSGKSTFARRFLLNAPLSYRFIWDEQQGKESYAHRLSRRAAADEWELGIQLCSGWVIFNPHVNWPGQMSEALNWFCDWLYKKIPFLPGLKCLWIDEAWKHIKPNRSPKEIMQCVQSGAGYGLECGFGTQTPHLMPEAIQVHCTEIVCFTLLEGGEKSLEWVARRGFNPEEIKALPKLHYVARNMVSGGELRGKIEI